MADLATAPPEPIEEEAEEPQQPHTDYGKDNIDLPEQLVNAIKAAIVKRQGEEKFSRRREVIRDRKLRFYESGHQHISWSNSSGGFAQLSSGGLATTSDGQQIQCPTFIDDWNILFPYLRILMAVLSQNPPGVNFQPLDPNVSEDIDKAKTAEGYAKAFDRMNDVKGIQLDIIRMMGLSGRTVSWTRTCTDAQRFGTEPDGSPKTFQRTTIHGTLETKVPIMCREFDKNFSYCFIYDDPDVTVAKDEYSAENDYGEVAEEIKAGTPALDENTYERAARLGVLIGSRSRAQLGDSLTHLVARVNAFLRPSNFTGDIYDSPLTAPDEGDIDEEGAPLTIGGKLKQLFPDGVRAIFVGDTYVGSFAESIDDHIDVQFPYPGDGMARPPFMELMVVVQDAFNDLVNWIREKVDTGAASTWIDGTKEEVDAVTSQRAAPNAIRAWKGTNGRPLADSFFKEDEIQIPETLFQLLETMRGELPEFLLSALPSLQGGEMSDNKTASGYAQANAQAKGQLGIIWTRIQRMFARIRYQSALAASRSDAQTGEMTIPGSGPGQNLTVNLDALKKGDFGCYPDEDSSFPESTQQKRATFMNLVTMAGTSPELAQNLENPSNLELATRMFGLDELVIPAAEARDKQLAEIGKLLQSAPIPPSPEALQSAQVAHAASSVAAHAQGLPEPPPFDPASLLQPSIQVDPGMDFHQWEWEYGQEWWSGPLKREEENKKTKDPQTGTMTEGNPLGLTNVRLHLLQHRKFMAEMAAQAAATAPHPAVQPPQHHAPPPRPAIAPAQPQPSAAPGAAGL